MNNIYKTEPRFTRKNNWLVLSAILFLLGSFVTLSNAQNNPCDCTTRWTGNASGTWDPNAPGGIDEASGGGIVGCGSGAGTISNISSTCIYDPVNDFAIPANALTNCFDPSPGQGATLAEFHAPYPGQEIGWYHFDVRAYGGTFEFQVVNNSNPIGWALFYTDPNDATDFLNPNGLSGNCANLIPDICGVNFNGWADSPFFVPDIAEPTNYYVMVWRLLGPDPTDAEIADSDFKYNFKARFGCGDREPFLCTVDIEDVTTNCNADGSVEVTVPISGINGNYVATAPGATSISPSSICLTNLADSNPVTSGTFTVTYPSGTTMYNITVAAQETATNCADPVNYIDCTASVSGTLPICCTLTVDCPDPVTIVSCTSQDDINSQFSTWIGEFSVNDCCSPTVTDLSGYSAPNACTGGSVEITYEAMNSCGETVSCFSSFTVNAAPSLVVMCPGDMTVGPCITQAEVNSAFNSWRDFFTLANPGCSPTISDLSIYEPPLACGGDVTIIFSATDDSCNPDVTCMATFTVLSEDAVEVNCPTVSNTISACATQDEIDAAFALWKAGFVVSNPGCGITSSTDLSGFSAPDRCAITDQSVTIDFSATDGCTTDECTGTFTVTARTDVVVVSCSTAPNTISACASQDDINAAFNLWKAGFTIVNPGCGITSMTDLDAFNAPLRCQTTNQSVTINFTATDGCSSDDCSATFTVLATPAVEVSCSTLPNTISACATQDEINAAFALWKTGFSVVEDGCGLTSVTDLDAFNAPVRCQTTNQSVTITFTATDGCTSDDCTATFTVLATPAVEVSCPTAPNTISACATQDDINAAFALWKAGFTVVEDGCGITSVTDLDAFNAPLRCQTSNQTVTINFTATDGCTSDDCSATFTVLATEMVEVSCPTAPNTISACASQDDINAAFNLWKAGFAVVEDGCGITLMTDLDAFDAPLRCQTTNQSVTIHFQATDGCSSDDCTATFTVLATTLVEVSCPTAPNTISACASQDDINAAFNLWKAGFTVVEDGCGITSMTDLDAFNVPLRCQTTNQSVTINFTATDGCSSDDCSATFTVLATPAVEVSCSTLPNTISACATQDEINAAFALWKTGFSVVEDGCGLTSVTDLDAFSAPVRCQTTNQSVTINFTATDGCTYDDCTAAFTVLATPAVEVSCPTAPNTISACASQDDINAAFALWKAGFTVVEDGCGITSVTDLDAFNAPLRCQTSNQTVTINFTATDGCTSDDCTATFTVLATEMVEVSCPTAPNTISACASQDDINAAFNLWKAGFTVVEDGCGITLMTDLDAFDAPLRCQTTNQSVTIHFQATDGCSSDDCTATFTVLATTLVEVSCPTAPNTISACASQDDINAAFNLWKAGFTIVNPGCGITSMTDLDAFDAPLRCQTTNQSVTINFTATDGCSSDDCSATFTVLATPAVEVSCSTLPNTISACATQDEINAAFALWKTGFSVVEDGCGLTSVTDLDDFDAPVRCQTTNQSVTITFTATDGCTSDDCTATFTVLATPAVEVSCPTAPNTISACATQDDINAAFALWKAGFTVVEDGCGITSVTDLDAFNAPLRCQTSNQTVTINFTATDGCTSDDCTATFTVLATEMVEVSCPTAPNTISACASQDDINAAFNLWKAGFTVVEDGCGITLMTDLDAFDAPLRCQTTNQSVTIHFQATDGCSSDDCTATFTVLATTMVEVSCPTAPNTISACASQDDINAAFNLWKAGFTIVNPGCGITSMTDLDAFNAPLRCQTTNQSVTINFTATDGCSSDDCSATFTVLATPAVEVSCSTLPNTISACATQDEINAAFALWKTGFSVVEDGCGLTSVTDLDAFNAPVRCQTTNQSVTINFTATDGCTSDDCTATFTVLATPAVEVSCPTAPNTISACATQDDINAAFALWKAGFTVVEDGCGITSVTDLDAFNAPLRCQTSNQTVTINFTATDGCTSDDCSATFTVLATEMVEVSCPTAPNTISACASQDDINAAFNLWKAGFTIVEDGCGITLMTDLDAFDAPLRCQTTNQSVTIHFQATDGCSSDDCTATFTVLATTMVEVSCPTAPNTISACASQDDINAAFNLWKAGFTVVEDGCGITSMTDLDAFNAPLRCQTTNQSVTINFTATDGCSSDDCSATFTVLATPAVEVSCSTLPNTISACATQDEINAAFAVWKTGFSVVEDGCGLTSVTDLDAFNAPLRCQTTNQSVTINFTATDGCTSDDCTATFTVLATTLVEVSCPTAPNTISACASQEEINAAFNLWKAGFTVTDPGCGITSITDLDPFTAPDRCATTDQSVTINFMATDGCSSDDCSATFTVLATTAVQVSCSTLPNTISACASQEEINAAFELWKTGFSVVDDGCGITSITDLDQFSAPNGCSTTNQSVTINFMATDGCSMDDCTATFTVLATTAVQVSCSTLPNTISACASQDEINAAFELWKTGFSVVGDGCGITSVTDLDQFSAPTGCNATNQSVTINFSASDGCSSDNCIATFTVIATSAVQVSCSTLPNTISACASQEEINVAFALWKTGFTVVEDGCGITSVTDLDQFTAPIGCSTTNQSVTINFNASDGCSSDDCTATFTVLATSIVEVGCPTVSNTISACASQEEINAAFALWKAGFTIADPGCGITSMTDLDAFDAPLRCAITDQTVTINFFATDGCSSDDCSASFTVFATEAVEVSCSTAPNSIGACASQAEIDQAFAIWIAGFSIDNPGCGITSSTDLSQYTAPERCGSEGNSVTVYFTATDGCSSDNCSATFTITPDTEAPGIDCGPGEITLGCNPEDIPTAQELIDIGFVTTTDNCNSIVVIAGNSDIVVNGCTYVQTHTFKAIDDCENESELCYVTVSWQQDNTVPQVICPAATSVQCTDDYSPESTGWADVIDNCSDDLAATYSDEIVPGSCEGEFTIYRTWSATDNCDNTGSCVQLIKVVDNIPPVITPIHPDLMGIPNGAEITVECQNFDPDWNPFIFDENDVIATDDCSNVTITMTDVLVEEGCTEDGVFLGFVSRWECKWIATDDCGNSSEYSFTMVVVDETPPVFTVTPGNIVASCDNMPSFDNVEAIDNCSNVELTYVDSQLPGDCIGEAIVKRVWTATDYCGNASTYTQYIQLIDNEAPTLYFHEPEMQQYTNGQEIMVDCEDLNAYIFNAEAAFGIDNCDYSPEVNYEFAISPSGNCSSDGYFLKVESRWTITDDCGNSTEFELTFYSVDNTPPVFTYVPTNICTTSDDLPEAGNATAFDDCSSVVDIEFFEFPIEDCGSGQVVERHWVATDLCGNSSTAVQMIIINDETGPTLEVEHPAFEGVGNGGTVTIEADCSNADLFPDLAPFLVISDECSVGFLTDINYQLMMEGDCATNGYLALYKLMIEVRDGCGNQSLYQYMVRLRDTQPPVFVDAEPELFLECTDELPEVYAEDNCSDVTMEVVQNEDYDVCSIDGIPLIRVFTATDACGNTATFEQVVHFYDETPPVLVGVPDDACGLPGPVAEVTAYDDCNDEAPEITLTEETYFGPCGSTTVRTWTATDACGNSTSESQFFFDDDSEAPVISLINPELEDAENGDVIQLQCGDLDFGVNDISVTDNCTEDIDVDLEVILLDSGDCSELGYFERYSYTWTAGDVCGNTSSVTLYFETIDNAPPGIHFVPDDLELYCFDGPLPPADGVMAFDNCSEVQLGMVETTQVISDNETLVTRTWKATDGCGNTTVETQNITLIGSDLSCSFPNAPEFIWCQSFDNKLTAEVTGGTGPYSYEWQLIDCDGIIVGGSGTHTITYISGLTPMTFGVTVTDANGCSTYCTITIDCMKKIEDDDTNFSAPFIEGELLENRSDEGKVTIAPNPASDQIFIGLQNFDLSKKAEIIITNIYGQVIERYSYDEAPVSAQVVNTIEYPNGLYSVLVIQENKKPVEHKFIIAH